MQTVEIDVCENASDAMRKGYMYREPVFQGLTIETIVLVKDGTMAHKPTVDIVLVDKTGQKFVAMTTAAIIQGALDIVK